MTCEEKRVLIIGDENSGVREIARSLVEHRLKSAYLLDVLTHTGLPLPGNRGLHDSRIQFLCFVIDTLSSESLQVVVDSLAKVDVSFFAGRCVLVVNTKGSLQDSVITQQELQNMATRHGIQVVHTNTQLEDNLACVGEKLMSMIGTAIGWERHISPLFYDCV